MKHPYKVDNIHLDAVPISSNLCVNCALWQTFFINMIIKYGALRIFFEGFHIFTFKENSLSKSDRLWLEKLCQIRWSNSFIFANHFLKKLRECKVLVNELRGKLPGCQSWEFFARVNFGPIRMRIVTPPRSSVVGASTKSRGSRISQTRYRIASNTQKKASFTCISIKFLSFNAILILNV